MKITVVKNGRRYELAADEELCPGCLTVCKKVVTSCAGCGEKRNPDAAFYDDDAFHQPRVSRADAEFHHLGG